MKNQLTRCHPLMLLFYASSSSHGDQPVEEAQVRGGRRLLRRAERGVTACGVIACDREQTAQPTEAKSWKQSRVKLRRIATFAAVSGMVPVFCRSVGSAAYCTLYTLKCSVKQQSGLYIFLENTNKRRLSYRHGCACPAPVLSAPHAGARGRGLCWR